MSCAPGCRSGTVSVVAGWHWCRPALAPVRGSRTLDCVDTPFRDRRMPLPRGKRTGTRSRPALPRAAMKVYAVEPVSSQRGAPSKAGYPQPGQLSTARPPRAVSVVPSRHRGRHDFSPLAAPAHGPGHRHPDVLPRLGAPHSVVPRPATRAAACDRPALHHHSPTNRLGWPQHPDHLTGHSTGRRSPRCQCPAPAGLRRQPAHSQCPAQPALTTRSQITGRSPCRPAHSQRTGLIRGTRSRRRTHTRRHNLPQQHRTPPRDRLAHRHSLAQHHRATRRLCSARRHCLAQRRCSAQRHCLLLRNSLPRRR
jgi:hypothetical protein